MIPSCVLPTLCLTMKHTGLDIHVFLKQVLLVMVDAWENETMSIIDVDMTSLEGDFVSMSFEYYADTFYEVDSQGNIEPSDYMALTVDYEKDSNDFSAIVYGQWNDYNEDGTCQIDEDGNGIVNETNPIDFDEIEYIGDHEPPMD